MNRFYMLSAIILTAIFITCSSPRETTDVWINKEKIKDKSYSNIFILVVTANTQARVRLEGDLANVAASRGIKTVKSIDLMPMDSSNPKKPSKEEVVDKVKASGCDAVFVASLLRIEERIKHTQGTNTYAPMNTTAPGGSYYAYYSNMYYTVSTPSYFTYDKIYYVQSNLYDAASEEKMWAVESEVFNPSDVDKFSKSYTQTLLSKLSKAKLLKK